MKPKTKFKGKLAVCLTVTGALLMAYALWEIGRIPDLLQYVVQADAETGAASDPGREPPPTLLRQRIDALDDLAPALSQVVTVYTVTGTAPLVSLTAEDAGAAAGLVAVGKNHFLVYPALLRAGRFPHPEELELGERVMLLDEQVALSLFKVADAVDREVELQGQTYRVIGVLRHQKRVGDEADQYVYVPLAAVAKRTDIPLETLRLTAVPVPKGGAMITFAEEARQWKSGGQAYDLRRERVGANIWARFFGCGVGFALLGWFISKYAQSISSLARRMREKLVTSYITRLLPYLIFHILLRVAGLALLAGLAAGLANLLLEPIKVFPEYVPSILVEPRIIAETFWNIRRAESGAFLIRTPQIIRLLYYGQLCNIAVILMLAGGCLIFWKWKRA